MSPDNIAERQAGSAAPGAPLGTAQWMSTAEALHKFSFDDKLFNLNDDGLWEGRSNGQLWVGETFEGEPYPIGYNDDRHVLVASGTRGGKGTGVIIPNLCLWPGSCIIIDPKGENATVTALRRGNGSKYAYGLSQTVRILDPFGEVQLDASLKARYNPLDAIDPESEMAVDDAARIAAALVVVESKTDPFWELAARNLIKAVILHVLTDPDFEGRRNLVSVWRLLRQGDWLTIERARKAKQENIPSGFTLLWHGMKRNEAYNGLIAGEAEQMLDMHERTRSGVLRVATTATEFIDGLPMQRLLETSDFDLADIKTDPKGLSIYLTLPQRFMTTHYRWLRLMIDLAVGEMERIKGRPATGFPTLFLLDEFAGLKRMETIEHAAAQAAGFGTKFFFVLQNLPQLKEVYGDAWETFLGNSGLRMFFQVDDNFTRKYLTEQLGEREVMRQTRSGSQSDSSSVSDTAGESTSTTRGTSSSTTTGDTVGASSSVTEGINSTRSWSASSGTSHGYTFNFKGMFGFVPRGRSHQGGTNQTESASRSDGRSHSTSHSTSRSRSRSESQSNSESRTGSTSTSRSQSQSRSTTDGWGEAVHKRNLLNPDEIGRFLSRIDDRNHPGYPGMVLALIPGEQALVARRVNYFQSLWFDGFFDPHSDHPDPPTLAERIARMAELKKKIPEADAAPPPEQSSEPRQNRVIPFAAAACVGVVLLAGMIWVAAPRGTPSNSAIEQNLPADPARPPAPIYAAPPVIPAPVEPPIVPNARTLTENASGNSVVFSPDGRFIAAATEDATLTIWDATNGQIVQTIDAQPTRVSSLSFSPDGKSIAAGTFNQNSFSAYVNNPTKYPKPFFKIWDVNSGRMLQRLSQPNRKEHRSADLVKAVRFLPDNNHLLTMGGYLTGPGAITLFDLRSGKVIAGPTDFNGGEPIIFPDGRAIAIKGIFGVEFHDLLKGQRTAVLLRERNDVIPIAISPDKQILAVLDGDKKPFLELVDASTGASLRKLAGYSTPESGETYTFLVAAFSPDGKLLAAETDTVIFLWEVATGTLLSKLTDHGKPVRALAFSPDGRTLASASIDHTVRLWDVDRLSPQTMARP